MADLIIGCSTNYKWDQLKYWVNSINKSGFDGDKVLIVLNCDKETVSKLVDAGFHVIAQNQNENGDFVYESNLAVHVERFLHIYNFLRTKEYRYVVTTDVKDVIFQKNPIDFIEKNICKHQNFLFASESIRYRDEPWGDNNLLETFGPFFHQAFRNNEIFNVGVLAGRGYAIRDLCAMIFNMSINRPIPIVDQAVFNFMVAQEPFPSTSRYLRSEEAWACQLGTTADPSKIEQFKPHLLEECPRFFDGKVVTSQGEEFTIVHQYDRVPEWRSIIEKKYG